MIDQIIYTLLVTNRALKAAFPIAFSSSGRNSQRDNIHRSVITCNPVAEELMRSEEGRLKPPPIIRTPVRTDSDTS